MYCHYLALYLLYLTNSPKHRYVIHFHIYSNPHMKPQI